MPDLDLLTVAVATAASFLLGFVYYGVFAGRLATAGDGTTTERPAWTLAVVELARNLVLATVVVGIVSLAEIDTWTGGLLLGLVLWVGFPFVLWTGAMFHEREPLTLAAIHGGDWLVKLLAIALIAALWA